MTEPDGDDTAPVRGIGFGVVLGTIGWVILLGLCVLAWLITR